MKARRPRRLGRSREVHPSALSVALAAPRNSRRCERNHFYLYINLNNYTFTSWRRDVVAAGVCGAAEHSLAIIREIFVVQLKHFQHDVQTYDVLKPRQRLAIIFMKGRCSRIAGSNRIHYPTLHYNSRSVGPRRTPPGGATEIS